MDGTVIDQELRRKPEEYKQLPSKRWDPDGEERIRFSSSDTEGMQRWLGETPLEEALPHSMLRYSDPVFGIAREFPCKIEQ